MIDLFPKFFQCLDLFPIIFQFRTMKDTSKHRSALGGFISFIIMSIWIAYTIFQLMYWQKGGIIPNINQYTEFQPVTSIVNLTYSTFTFSLSMVKDDNNVQYLNKVNEGGKLFDLAQSIWKDGQYYSGPYISDEKICYEKSTKGSDYILEPLCQNYKQEINQDQSSIYMTSSDKSAAQVLNYYIIDCQGEDCLGNEIFQEMADEADPIIYDLVTIKQAVDFKTGEVIFVPKLDQFYIRTDQQLTITFTIKKALLSIDNGILFESKHQQEIISNVDIQYYYEPRRPYGDDRKIFVELFVQPSIEVDIINIQYPKIGQIIAECVSILQLLLQVGWIVSFYNQRIYQNYMKDELTKIYFPEMRLINFQRNRGGQVNKFDTTKKFTLLDQQKIIQKKQQIDSIILEKLNFFNLLHEVKILQVLIFNFLSISNTNINSFLKIVDENFILSLNPLIDIVIDSKSDDKIQLPKNVLDFQFFKSILLSEQQYEKKQIPLTASQAKQAILKETFYSITTDENRKLEEHRTVRYEQAPNSRQIQGPKFIQMNLNINSP